MIKKVNDALFNTHVIPSDWRYSAAIVGLEKYLYNQNLEYEIKDEYFAFNQEDITRERFLEFAEEYYSLSFPHKRLEIQLRKDEFSQEEKKQINELLKSNAIMKKIFGKIKFDGDNKVEILECIRKNRLILTQETFRNKSDMYADFANPNLLFEEKRDCCRLWGYYIDGARKSKNLSFAFRTESFASEDCQLFDFIPFAFCGERESLFINDNYSVKQLIDTNQQLIDKLREEKEKKPDKYQTARKILFKSIQESSAFIDYDVEVMTKNRNRDFFETLYIRKRSIDILSELEVYEPFCFSVQLGKEYYLDVQKEVMDCILNLKDADELIEFFLKRDSEYLVSLLIKLNLLIKERGKNMTKGMTVAYACAKKVAERLPENNRKSYRQRLTSSLALKDYSAFLDILAQLSNYTDIQFDFVYDLFENFEDNKELAYTFANAMTKKSKVQDKQTGGKENE